MYWTLSSLVSQLMVTVQVPQPSFKMSLRLPVLAGK